MRSFALAAALALVPLHLIGCVAGTSSGPDFDAVGDGPGPGPGGPDPATPEVTFATDILPLVLARCSSCHLNPAIAPAWMAGDAYTTMLGWPSLIVPGEPDQSLLVSYGAHTGPAWPTAEADLISRWILAEGGVVAPPAGGVEPPPGLATDAVVIADGPNRIDLGAVGLEGAYVTFVAMQVALGLHLSDVQIHSGSARGAHIEHPQLVVWSGTTRTPDPDDRFSGVELSIAAGSQASLSTAVLLVDFPAGGSLSIEFRAAAPL